MIFRYLIPILVGLFMIFHASGIIRKKEFMLKGSPGIKVTGKYAVYFGVAGVLIGIALIIQYGISLLHFPSSNPH